MRDPGRSATSCPASVTRRSEPPPELTTTCGSVRRRSARTTPTERIYHFRWFWDYSGGQMTNLGPHEIDIVHWVMKSNAPGRHLQRRALGTAGQRRNSGHAGRDVRVPGYDHALLLPRGERRAARLHGLELAGTKGTLAITRGGFEVVPDMKIDPNNAIPTFNGRPSGGPERSSAKGEPWCQPVKDNGSSAEQLDLRVRNFLKS